MQNDPRAWHALGVGEALAAVDGRSEGLSEEEAAQRLLRYGANHLTPPRRPGPVARFLRQFHNLLIYVLLAAAGVTATLGHLVDTSVILGVVLINALIGFIQEGKAESSLDAIRRMLSLSATVLRDGQRRRIDAEQLVPGDIVVLASGDRVPADLRLISGHNLRIDEAPLTGESEAVEKTTAAVPYSAGVGDRFSMAYSGTLVVYGQARGVVVATGDSTEIGRIGKLLATVESVETPLLRQMAVFGRWLTAAILVLSVLTPVVGVVIHDFPVGEMFVAAVGLAVAAIPEGLPAIMTITLAIGVQRMAVRNAIIRRMPAVETLGAVTTICTDKTGTLTRNEMTVQRVVMANAELEVTGAGYAPHGGFVHDGRDVDPTDAGDLLEVARAALLCNDATLREPADGSNWQLDGDPTDGGLLALAMKAGLDPRFENAEFPRIDAIPFESEHRFMATLHHDHTGHAFAYVKGAPERIIETCTYARRVGEDQPVNPGYWHETVDRLARNGYRVLALAVRSMPRGQTELRFDDVETGMTLLALVGIIDPPREEAVRSVAACRAAGIRVKMITGDHAVTALAIARTMGLRDDAGALTGQQIEAMDDQQLRRRVADVDVFARASPENKLRLVQALQANGEVTAMTGDGVNDAPALKRADVGVAMGAKGTEAAKEAAEMVLADDNFASIAAAVEEGRTIYDNLRKAIIFVLPTNGGEAVVIALAVLLGLQLPITPVQILWVNMVTAVTLALALAFERPETDILRRPPRNSAQPLIDRFMLWRIAFVVVLLVAISFGLFVWELSRGMSVEVARTAAVNGMVFGEIFYLLNCRRLQASILNREGLFGNRVALKAIAALTLLQLAFTELSFMQRLFGTATLDAASWLGILAAGILLFLAVELEKALLRRRQAGTSAA